MDRKRISGAAHRRKSKEKTQMLADVLSKTKKMKNYFYVPNASSELTYSLINKGMK